MLIADPTDAYRYLYRALGQLHERVGMRVAELQADAGQARARGARDAATIFEARTNELERLREALRSLRTDFEPTRLGLDP